MPTTPKFTSGGGNRRPPGKTTSMWLNFQRIFQDDTWLLIEPTSVEYQKHCPTCDQIDSNRSEQQTSTILDFHCSLPKLFQEPPSQEQLVAMWNVGADWSPQFRVQRRSIAWFDCLTTLDVVEVCIQLIIFFLASRTLDSTLMVNTAIGGRPDLNLHDLPPSLIYLAYNIIPLQANCVACGVEIVWNQYKQKMTLSCA